MIIDIHTTGLTIAQWPLIYDMHEEHEGTARSGIGLMDGTRYIKRTQSVARSLWTLLNKALAGSGLAVKSITMKITSMYNGL